MDEVQFWSLIEGTSSSGSSEEQAEEVREKLKGLDAIALVAFKSRFTDLSNSILTWNHLGAAEVIMGFTSEDVFSNFRTWVIYQGREVYTSFRDDPDSLAKDGPTSDEAQIGPAEILEFLPDDAYAEAAGKDLGEDYPQVGEYRAEPAGQKIEHSYLGLAKRFPKLATVYLPTPRPQGSPMDSGPRPIQRRG
jgi:Protein of unknown function (DUF4240)